MSPELELYKATCWPFGIVEGCPKDKDERVEDWSWEVVPGMALRYYKLSRVMTKAILLMQRPSTKVNRSKGTFLHCDVSGSETSGIVP
jgi:hypothetical protein